MHFPRRSALSAFQHCATSRPALIYQIFLSTQFHNYLFPTSPSSVARANHSSSVTGSTLSATSFTHHPIATTSTIAPPLSLRRHRAIAAGHYSPLSSASPSPWLITSTGPSHFTGLRPGNIVDIAHSTVFFAPSRPLLLTIYVVRDTTTSAAGQSGVVSYRPPAPTGLAVTDDGGTLYLQICATQSPLTIQQLYRNIPRSFTIHITTNSHLRAFPAVTAGPPPSRPLPPHCTATTISSSTSTCLLRLRQTFTTIAWLRRHHHNYRWHPPPPFPTTIRPFVSPAAAVQSTITNISPPITFMSPYLIDIIDISLAPLLLSSTDLPPFSDTTNFLPIVVNFINNRHHQIFAARRTAAVGGRCSSCPGYHIVRFSSKHQQQLCFFSTASSTANRSPTAPTPITTTHLPPAHFRATLARSHFTVTTANFCCICICYLQICQLSQLTIIIAGTLQMHCFSQFIKSLLFQQHQFQQANQLAVRHRNNIIGYHSHFRCNNNFHSTPPTP